MNFKATAIQEPTRTEKRELRFLIIIGMMAMAFFLFILFEEENEKGQLLYVLFMVTIIYYCLKYLHEWYHYFSLSSPKIIKSDRIYSVDIFTTYCAGEPLEMLEKTLTAIQKVTYAHTTWCGDEAKDPTVKAMCERLGVMYVTRPDKRNAKAGNINNILQYAKGELCMVLDPDHMPAPELLNDIVHRFDDPAIGFVQIVQAYYNHHQSLVAKGAAQQTYQFYGPMMMSMNTYGTVQAIGANCVFRRSALDSIGGHAPGLAEDMNTAMHLHAKGWRSLYLPVVLTRGLVPSTLSAYYKQQLKWSRGTFELLVTTYVRFFRKFTWQQKLHYFTLPFHYLCGFIFLINFLIPILSLFTDTYPLRMDLVSFFMAALPLISLIILIRHYVQKWVAEEAERGFHIVGGLVQIGTWWIHLTGIVYTILRKKVSYIPTPKKGGDKVPFRLLLPHLVVIIVSLTAILYGLQTHYTPYTLFMAGLAGLNIFFMSFVFYISGKSNEQSGVPVTTLRKIKSRLWVYRHILYGGLRRYALLLSFLIMGISFFTYQYVNKPPTFLQNPKPGELPEVKILKPAKTTFKGLDLTYHVIVRKNNQWIFADKLSGDIHYNWHLIYKNQEGHTSYFKKIGEGPSITITIPSDPQNCYLYLEAVKGKNVRIATSTLNIPLD